MSRVILCLTLLAPLAGCSGPGRDRKVIGLSVLTLTNPFFKEIADNFREEAANHGYDVVAVSGDMDVAKQDRQVRDFVVRRVEAIVLCPCESRSIGPTIQHANTAGI